ncbi:aminotransferase class III-fold pyridoxal phosphate-dependent enzyme [Streptomyces antimycoticus]|uniref:Aspartate aminotransferase family protein n=1 Tax=Streptomyces antimycoticus TaxID=68175 RepID=A0A4D4K0S0_9ACTN|nr:aminotransferase class III-fold pyridoxal phosphate-dependent enzyme [Streptomyces antimycoticus]GDY39533.1 aspartate aminotransferase family protein [Streptomyces antimycoticus]
MTTERAMTTTKRLPTPQEAAQYQLGDITLVGGEGIRAWDAEGRAFLDCVSGTFNLLLGHNHPEVMAAVREQTERLVFASSSFQTEPTNRVIQELAAISPPNLTRVNLRSSSGSTANEGAIKMAQLHTGRRDVIVPFRAHLGQSLATASLNGTTKMRAPFPYRYPGGLHVPGPYCFRCFYRQTPESCGMLCVDRIEDFITYASSGSVACVVIEPISGAGGNIVPPDGYLQELRQFCDEREIVLIFDEIQTGLGRTGQMFAADHFGVQPHMMTLAKGLTGSGLPMAAILTEERMADWDRSLHSFTYGSHTLSAAAALATLEIIQRPGFLENVRASGDVLLGRLRDLQKDHPVIGDVRGVGLMIGVELVEPDGTQATARANAYQRSLQSHGILTRVSEHGNGSTIELRPPLILTPAEAHTIADRFGEALEAIA